MFAYNINTRKSFTDTTNLLNGDKYFFSIVRSELKSLLKLLGTRESLYYRISDIGEKVIFSSFYEHDYLSFIYYIYENKIVSFEKFSILLSDNCLIFISEDGNNVHDSILNELINDYLNIQSNEISISSIYYNLLNNSFSNMFEALDSYESMISDVEDNIIDNDAALSLSDISDMKKVSHEIKKYNRQLLYIGDQIILDSNGFVDDENIIYFRNLDTKINILYEYSTDIHERTEHLKNIYDSNANDKTNSLLTRITLLTALATPVSIISGLYGMNFVHMPALKNPYGYYIALAVMIISIISIILFLKKKKLI